MILYTADLHFGHYNIIHHDGRPWKTADEMDEALIELWNNKVTDNDDVYIDGDFAFRNGKPVSYYASRLKGKLHLIMGNHDRLTPDDRKYFVEIKDRKTIKDNGRTVVIDHFPMAEWDGFFRGVYHVYAHIHNNTNAAFQFMRTLNNALNAGCMINGYVPVTLDELIENNKKFKASVE